MRSRFLEGREKFRLLLGNSPRGTALFRELDSGICGIPLISPEYSEGNTVEKSVNLSYESASCVTACTCGAADCVKRAGARPVSLR